MNTNYKSIILSIGLFFALFPSVLAAPSDLDPTFGNGGLVITRGSNMNHLQTASAMAIQADGKIVVVGEGAVGNTWDFAVVRYNTDGSLDTSFGGSGIVITPIQSGFHEAATAVAIQADGRILVAGSSGGFALVRYNTDGSLDTSFNKTGKVITGDSYARDLAIQADGMIVAIGGEVALRFKKDGMPDTSFGGTGRIFLGITANSVAIQADGKIVAAGRHQTNFAIVRHNPDGSPDTTFNETGKVITQVGNAESWANELAIQPDGRIIVVGTTRNFPIGSEFAVVRYNPNGSLDTTFGGTGKVIIPIGNFGDYAYSAAIQADGKIVVGGQTSVYSSTRSEFGVVRFNPNGSLDTTFNGTGKVITRIANGFDWASSVVIQADGSIVVAGNTETIWYDYYDFAVVRYEGGSNANIRTRFDFDGDGKADISVFRPSDRVWYLNQSTNGFSATQFGLSTDKITPADYDGDGKTDISVYRAGTWYWLNSSNQSVGIIQFGIASDIPVPADYTGDGKSELAVYRNGVWWIQDLTDNQTQVVNFGLASDKPVPADYDGDGRIDEAIYRNGEWHLNRSTQGYAVVNFGLATDRPVIGDYDGDGRADQAVYRDGVWYLQQSSQGFSAFQFGLAADIPVPADYDGDGRMDAAVYRGGVWWIRQSTGGISVQQFGLPNDIPVSAAFLP